MIVRAGEISKFVFGLQSVTKFFKKKISYSVTQIPPIFSLLNCFYENVSVNNYTISENDSIFFHQVWFVNISPCKQIAYAIEYLLAKEGYFAGFKLAPAVIDFPFFT